MGENHRWIQKSDCNKTSYGLLLGGGCGLGLGGACGGAAECLEECSHISAKWEVGALGLAYLVFIFLGGAQTQFKLDTEAYK